MKYVFKLTRLAFLVSVTLNGLQLPAYAREYFNPALLEVDTPNMKGTDLSSFENGSQAPGTYRVDIVINGQLVDTKDVNFKSSEQAENKLEPCLSVAMLQSYGVKTSLFPELEQDEGCANLSAIPKASVKYLFGSHKLMLSIPQAALSPKARGYVAPELWDEGIPAFLMNYSFSGDNTTVRNGAGHDSNSEYASLQPGINLGAWRIRNYTTWNRDSNGQDKWDTVYTFAQRNIISLKSKLTLGDSSSPSDIFDSLPFRGAQLASDDDMLADSLKGYAPVVRGIAQTNAQVIIRQNGYIIYQSYVAPGAFEIKDMYPTGGAGDLIVTVKEADGRNNTFIVPFASVPILQREGRFKYSITGGKYRSYDNQVEEKSLIQGTAIYGLPYGFTIYGGVQESSVYQSFAFGLGKNLGEIGAISTDVTQASSDPNNLQHTTGQSWRIRYSKDFIGTGTNLSIAGYRYSTKGYYGMQEILDSYGDEDALTDRKRNRAELTVSQSMGEGLGSLSISAVKENYWDNSTSTASYSVGYNNSWHGITYGVNYSYSKNSESDNTYGSNDAEDEQTIALNISVPLSKFLSNTWANYNMNTSKHGNTTHSVGISGMALENNALTWNMQEGYGTDNVGNTGSLNADYRGTYGKITGGYSYDTNTERMSMGVSGGILAHSGGIVIGQPLGETNALIDAAGAAGVSVNNQSGVKTDFRGYTIMSNLSPYRKNDISLNTETLPDDVELELTSKTVIPTRGAVVRARYNASIGDRVLLTLTQRNGSFVPFGATVTIEGSENVHEFIVGDSGQVYLTGIVDNMKIKAQWGKENDMQCFAPLHINKASTEAGIFILQEKCM